MPSLCDIEGTEIRSALAQIWLCDHLPESCRIRYRLAGEEINDFWGCNLSGKHLDEIIPVERLATVRQRSRLAVDLPAIIHDRVCLSLTKEITRNGERIILPLSDDGRTVNALLGATHRNWFRELEFDPYSTCSETTTVAALYLNGRSLSAKQTLIIGKMNDRFWPKVALRRHRKSVRSRDSDEGLESTLMRHSRRTAPMSAIGSQNGRSIGAIS